jgi:hypothetical protein
MVLGLPQEVLIGDGLEGLFSLLFELLFRINPISN